MVLLFENFSFIVCRRSEKRTSSRDGNGHTWTCKFIFQIKVKKKEDNFVPFCINAIFVTTSIFV